MSGVHDGLRLTYSSENGDGEYEADQNKWILSIGRQEETDVCLRSDTFVSRMHAYLYWEEKRWWLKDNNSTNGTFIESGERDTRVTTNVPVQIGDLFRIGHTWMRIEKAGEEPDDE